MLKDPIPFSLYSVFDIILSCEISCVKQGRDFVPQKAPTAVQSVHTRYRVATKSVKKVKTRIVTIGQ